MSHPNNGRTIRIPIQKAKNQLPLAENPRRPLLTPPEDDAGADAGKQPGGKQSDANLNALVSQLTSQVDQLQSEVQDWKSRASGFETESESLRQQTADLRTELEEWKTQASDFEAQLQDWKAEVARLRNREAEIRRQVRHQAQSSVREERERLLHRLIVVADDLERALDHADDADPLYTGVRLTLDDLLAQLAKEGVVPFQGLGESFDPTQHEAVATDGSGGNMVVKVLRTGYTENGALLRPARVIVGAL